MIVSRLESPWSARPCGGAGAPEDAAGRFPVDVAPGESVHHGLVAAGVIPPVDTGDGEARQEWVGRTDWEFAGAVPLPEAARAEERIDLVLDSVDTVARIALNARELGAVADQFVQHRFDVRGSLAAEDAQRIVVRARAPVTYVLEEEARLGARPVNGDWTPYPFVRKSACNFGWDWGPRVPTCGIPGEVRIEAWSTARIAEVRPLVVACDAKAARVEVRVRVEWASAPVAGLHARCELRMPPREANAEPDHRKKGEKRPSKIVELGAVAADGTAVAVIEVERPERWWPRGFGRQPLHTLHVELVDAAGEPLARGDARQRIVCRIGLRSCALDTGADGFGSRFAFAVNGVRVPVTGANWIPAGMFPCAARDRAATERLLDLAVGANLNMLRVWGGGIYEPDAFYDRCDELGLLVWQDFMFACATYPEDEPMPALVEEEARQQVARLCGHPSIVLWCGGNEDVLAWQSWGFRDRLRPGQSWGLRYWTEILPRVCAELDPTRPYWTESPWSGSLERHANDPDHGDRHTWDVKLDAYRSVAPRFTSEFGHQSPPNMETIREALGDAALAIGSPALAVRQRGWGGDEAQYASYLAAAFHPARDFGEWLWQAQLLQARAMETCIAWLRANPARSGGSLFWQLNDVWSGHSWSVIDARLRPKPAYHAVRRAAAPRLVTVQPVGPVPADGAAFPGASSGAGALRVVLVNDMPSRWAARVTVRRIDMHGRTLAEAQERVVVAPRGTDASVDPLALVGAPADPVLEGLVVDVASHEDAIAEEMPVADRDRMRAWWWFAPDVARPRTEPRFDISVGRSIADRWVQVHARTLVRDLWVEPACDWAECTPNLVSLLPGERVHMALRLRGSAAEDPVLRVHAL